jgi:hypothetical protein
MDADRAKDLRAVNRPLRIAAVMLLVVVVIMAAWVAAFTYPMRLTHFAADAPIVADARVGEVPAVAFTRTIKRNFVASYAGTVRRVDGREIVFDFGSGVFEYEAGARLPANADLCWWTVREPACRELEVGTYYLNTCWTIYWPLLNLVPPRQVCRRSEPFTIRPA